MGLVHKDFPFHVLQSAEIDNINEIADDEIEKLLPTRPTKLPYLPTEENLPKLEKWFLDKFQLTAMNVDGKLRRMKGKAHKIHIEPEAKPHSVHTPVPVPHHMKQDVQKQLDEDVEKGILRKAPIGEPNDWCMRMVVVRKKNGKLRRAIDFRPLNLVSKREPHHTPTPFEVVSNIPPRMYKTVIDAYNGYHQVELDEDSIPLTTFSTEYGRYQYLS